ncbi:hypothetical protein [Hydrogenophaga defluvii]|uniref:DUF302 domain-containing protein n=1 Tax=Hydrogenophaga defluvii TaxID=249410 RepID=A0ABW2SGM3_9BURK
MNYSTDVLAFLRKQIESAGTRVLGSGIVPASPVDYPAHEWVYSRQRGYSMEILLSPATEAPSVYGDGGVSLRLCLIHQSQSAVVPVFWFRLDDDPKAMCWRTLPTLIEAVDGVLGTASEPYSQQPSLHQSLVEAVNGA